jgi:hypothetical protein
MKKNSLLYLLIIVLVISNAVFVFLHFKKHNRGERHNPGSFVAKQLDFNESQMIKFEALNKDHENEMKSIFKETKKIKDQLFTNIGNKDYSTKELDSLTNSMGYKMALRGKITFTHFNAILKICETEQQKKDFKSIIKKAMQRGKPNK